MWDFSISFARLITVSAIYAIIAATIFMVLMTVVRWRWILSRRPVYALLYWVLILFALFSTIIRTFIYEAGKELAPRWFPLVIDAFWVVLCILMVATLWERKR